MQTCANCHIGTLQRKTGTYAAWHGDQWIVMPGTPIWVCDVCGERTYDLKTLDQLLPLIGLPASPNADADAAGPQRSADVQPPFTNARTRRRA